MDEQDKTFKKLLEFLEKNPSVININPNFDQQQTATIIQLISLCRLREFSFSNPEMDSGRHWFRAFSENINGINEVLRIPVKISDIGKD